MKPTPSGAVAEAGRATLSDIARRAEVSRSTVSLVLRGSPLVADKTRSRVVAAIDELGYVYNRGAASMRSGRSQTVGLLVSEITNPFYAELTAGIERVLEEAGLLTFLANSNEDADRQGRFIQRMREQGADGIILSPAEGTERRTIEDLQRSRVPVVQILRQVPGTATDYIGADYRLGTELATEHLIRRGQTRIAFLGAARQTSASAERLLGFNQALERNGLAPAGITPCSSSRIEAAEAVIRMMSRTPRPNALLCHSDVIALGALSALGQLGLEPGTEVGVIGFDNVTEAALSRPALSTIAAGTRHIGEVAAHTLLQRIAHPGSTPERIILPPRLVIRAT
jgi:LacI family transcriptional regulator